MGGNYNKIILACLYHNEFNNIYVVAKNYNELTYVHSSLLLIYNDISAVTNYKWYKILQVQYTQGFLEDKNFLSQEYSRGIKLTPVTIIYKSDSLHGCCSKYYLCSLVVHTGHLKSIQYNHSIMEIDVWKNDQIFFITE